MTPLKSDPTESFSAMAYAVVSRHEAVRKLARDFEEELLLSRFPRATAPSGPLSRFAAHGRAFTVAADGVMIVGDDGLKYKDLAAMNAAIANDDAMTVALGVDDVVTKVER